jgi:hypothetical protein
MASQQAPARPRPAPDALRRPRGLALRQTASGSGLYANRRFEAGEPLFSFLQVTWRAAPDADTVEHPCGRSFHDPVLALVARSVDPNARIAANLMALIARRDIARGERITIAPKRGGGRSEPHGQRRAWGG